ncbi:Fc.00g042930.m01.CDS01 [Cosmosporella sp. VM-42]
MSTSQGNQGEIQRSIQYLHPYSGMPINVWVRHAYEIDIPSRQQPYLMRTGVRVPITDLRDIDLESLGMAGGVHILDGALAGLPPMTVVNQNTMRDHVEAVAVILQAIYQADFLPTCVDVRVRASRPAATQHEECMQNFVQRGDARARVPCFIFPTERPMAYPELDPMPAEASRIVRNIYYTTELAARGTTNWLLVEVCHPLREVITRYPFVVSDPRYPALAWDLDSSVGAVLNIETDAVIMRRRYLHHDPRHRWCYLNNQQPNELLVRHLVSSKEIDGTATEPAMIPMTSINITNDRNAVAEDVIKMRFVIWINN